MRATKLSFFVFSLLATSCGSSSPDATSSPTTDAGADTVAAKSTKIVSWSAPEHPVGGVKVFVLAKDGAVLASTTTGADGSGTLEGFELTDETVFVAAGKEGSSVELDPFNKAVALEITTKLGRAPTDPLPVLVFPIASKQPKLTGAAKGFADGSTLVATSTNGLSVHQGVPDKFSIAVMPGEKGTLVGVETLQMPAPRAVTQTVGKWVIAEHPAITADTPFDLDFTKPSALTSKRVKIKLEIPGGADGPLGGDSFAFGWILRGTTLNAMVGLFAKSGPNADGTAFDVELEYIEPTFAGTSKTVLRLHRSDGAWSERTLMRIPTEGEVVKDWRMPLPITSAKQALTDPISLEGIAKDETAFVVAQKTNGDLLFRSVVPPAFTSGGSITLPKLPEELRALLPPLLASRIRNAVITDPKAVFVEFSGVSRPITFTP